MSSADALEQDAPKAEEVPKVAPGEAEGAKTEGEEGNNGAEEEKKEAEEKEGLSEAVETVEKEEGEVNKGGDADEEGEKEKDTPEPVAQHEGAVTGEDAGDATIDGEKGGNDVETEGVNPQGEGADAEATGKADGGEEKEESRKASIKEDEKVEVEATNAEDQATGSKDVAKGSEDKPKVEGGLCTIDFIILPEHFGQTKKIDINLTIKEIRRLLEGELSIPEETLFLMNLTGAAGGVSGMLDVNKTLASYGVQKGQKIGIELRINYYRDPDVEEVEGKYVMPDVLELKIQKDGETTVVPVLIERPRHKKPFLGGYHNKNNSLEYHHAFTQTPKQQKGEQEIFKYHRETQTADLRSRSSQCAREIGTQMDKLGLFLSKDKDVIKEAHVPYFSSADLFAVRLEMAIIIQCHVRGMFARLRARQLRKEREIKRSLQAKEHEREKLEEELRHKREIERRIHPRTYEDFEVLRGELDSWRINETTRIQNSSFDNETKQAALRQLLHKETKLLQTIDKLRIQARHQNRDQKIQKRLEAMAQPKVWAQRDLETTTVHTPFTTRARELMDLYNGLRVPLLTIDERLDVLLHVKWTAKEFDCNLTREIVDLVDREADMLNRGRPETSFKGLRKRLGNLFLQFVETPEFNPEAQRFQKVPRDLSTHQNLMPTE